MTTFTESVVEQAAQARLAAPCYAVFHGLEIAPGESKGERIIGRVC